MEGQLYVIQIDRCKQYPKNAEHYLQQGQFALHAGGRGNGAVGGLYTKKQINRIIGKYPEGAAKAIPVVVGRTEEQLKWHYEWAARNAHWSDCLDKVVIPEPTYQAAKKLFEETVNPYE